MLGSEVRGHRVETVLVEERIKLSRELYLGFSVDLARGTIAALASPDGGVEIEETARIHPERIRREEVDILSGLADSEVDRLAAALELPTVTRAAELIRKVYDLFIRYDALLLEINPLGLTEAGELIALDGRMELDDDAAFRHPEFTYLDDTLTPLEKDARASGLMYVELDGDIGVIGNGAGLNMATLDMLKRVGLKPANFLEVGGRTYSLAEGAIKIVCSRPGIRAVFGNFYGCISRNDVIAQGLAGAVKKGLLAVPMIVAMRGNGAAEGRKLLQAAGVEVFEDDEPAARRLADLLSNPGRDRR
jgi:succinyl-CoA synthetase beta subunit